LKEIAEQTLEYLIVTGISTSRNQGSKATPANEKIKTNVAEAAMTVKGSVTTRKSLLYVDLSGQRPNEDMKVLLEESEPADDPLKSKRST